MKKCPHCGTEQPDGNIYCIFCSKSMIQLKKKEDIEEFVLPVDVTPDDEPLPEQEQKPPAPIAKPIPKKNMIPFLLVILLLVGGALVWVNKDKVAGSINQLPSAVQQLNTSNQGYKSGIPSEYGNSFINISEGGLMVADNDYIYYTKPSDKYKIYRMNHNMEESEMICDVQAFYLNYKDGALYFGGAKKGHRQLFKLDLETLEYEKLCNQSVYEPKLVGNSIFYEDIDDDYSLWRYDIDSDSTVKICDGIVFYCCIGEEWIYYLDTWDDYKAYKIDFNGGNKTLLYDGVPSRELCLSDGILYRSVRDGGICAEKLSTGEEWTISDVNARSLNVGNNAIYYSDVDNGKYLYKMDLNGDNIVKLSNQAAELINVYGDMVSYREPESKAFYWILDGQSNSIQIE